MNYDIIVIDKNEDVADYLESVGVHYNLGMLRLSMIDELDKYLCDSSYGIKGVVLGSNSSRHDVEFLSQYQFDIPLLFLNQTDNQLKNISHEKITVLDKTNFTNDDLITFFAARCKVNIANHSTYTPVPIQFFMKYETETYRAYTQIEGERFHEIQRGDGGQFKRRLDDLYKGGKKQIYLKPEQAIQFFDEVKKNIFSRRETPAEQLLSKHCQVAEFVISKLKTFGISDAELGVATKKIDSLVGSFLKHKQLKHLMSEIVNCENYQYRLSIMVSYISIILNRKCFDNNVEINTAYIQAALFQDLELESEMVKISTRLEMGRAKVDSRTQIAILNHPLASMNRIKNLKYIQNLTLNLIKFHHERIGGEGFPSATDVSILSMPIKLYVLSNDLAHDFLDSEEAKVQEVLSKKIEKYNTKNFAKIYKIVGPLFEKKL